MLIKYAKPICRTALILIAFLLPYFCSQGQGVGGSSYDQLVVTANSLLKEGKLDEAKQTAQQAIRQNASGYMAYAVAAKIASQQGKADEARKFVQEALQCAPAERKAQVQQLATMLAPAGTPVQTHAPAVLSDEDRLQLNVLSLLLERAGKAATTEEREQACSDILSRSGEFIMAHPEQAHVWVMRGVAAVVLNRAHEGWEAGQHLKALGMMHSEDADVSKLLAELDLKGWLGREPKGPQPDQRWTNSLGQVFVPVPSTGVLFCIWDTRVQDFGEFVSDTGYDATQGMYSQRADGSKQRGDTWKSPGFIQGLTHPVCGVSWDDAQAFCRWLTEKERGKGLLGENQSYRLPKDAEWSMAVGNDRYPWGNQWPPPAGVGNYAGSEARDKNWPPSFDTIPGYQDGFARTSPVGSFAANRLGLFDMGGNVWQWCEDWFQKEMNSGEIRQGLSYLDDYSGQLCRVTRGASWNWDPLPVSTLSVYHRPVTPSTRVDGTGFRCVLVAGGVVR